MLRFEREAAKSGFPFSIGIDEAGRGPLAGPVVAAAVYLTSTRFTNRVNDSKQMTPKARAIAFDEIFERGVVGIGIMSETAIDTVNILNAAHLAMETAVLQLTRRMANRPQPPCPKTVMLLVDGNSFRHQLPYQSRTIVDGDARSLSIACASVVAKVYRDRLMERYHSIYPQYGFDQHKGYPTEEHRRAIAAHGPSVIHRKTFTLL